MIFDPGAKQKWTNKVAFVKLHARSKDISFSKGRVWYKLVSETADHNKEVIELEPSLGAYREFGPNRSCWSFKQTFGPSSKFKMITLAILELQDYKTASCKTYKISHLLVYK